VRVGTLLIRADAGVNMGTGHAMRCLALAQAWQDSGGRCVFVMANSTSAVERRLKAEGIEVETLTVGVGSAEDAKQTVHIGGEQNADWIVVDGYQFDSAYQSAVRTAEFKLLLIDDNFRAGPYHADIVLNQNIHAKSGSYANCDSSTQFLLGSRYVLLRKEFRPWRNWRREISANGRRVLVTMGGSDPNNLTASVVDAIRKLSIPNLETIVLVGGSNPHLSPIEKSIQSDSTRVIIDAANVPELMAWADVAVSGAGTTLWEMCFLGLPGILLVLAENQEDVAATAGKMGIAWSLGNAMDVSVPALAEKLAALLDSKSSRMSQSKEGKKLVDGRGAERVVAFLSGLELRRTTDSDCEVFWEWANDAEARAASFNGKMISWEDHEKWFQAKLDDPKAMFYTAMNRDGVPIGEIRYQVNDKRAVLSISLDARFRGGGWGQKILAVGAERIFQDTGVEFIDAYVKPTNLVSLKLFAGAGFQRLPPKVIEEQEGIHFVLERIAFP
jgi:UDP-2,4-diacetamido-2,4,6-trideoxy-beta-L-altropyranose hydrolase